MKKLQAAPPPAFSTGTGFLEYRYYTPKSAVYDKLFLHPGQAYDPGGTVNALALSPAAMGTPVGSAAAAMAVPSTTIGTSTSTFMPSALNWSSELAAGLDTTEFACRASAPTDNSKAQATGLQHLEATMNLEHPRIAVKFRIQMPLLPMEVDNGNVSAGFTIFQFGDGSAGTIKIEYFPRQGDTQHPHELIASVVGVTDFRCTAHPEHSDIMIPVYLEYDGYEMVFFCDRSSDHYFSATPTTVSTNSQPVLFGADYYVTAGFYAGDEPPTDQIFYFDNLEIYSHTLVLDNSDSAEPFPYIEWDDSTSGVIAVYPTPTIPADYYTFVDIGYVASSVGATFDLTASTVASPTAYINEIPVPIGTGLTTGATVASWLRSTPLAVTIDGRVETISFSGSGSSVTAAGASGAKSYSLRFTGAVGADWDVTKPLLGKIPMQFQYPYTGEVCEGISILGTNAQVTTPKALQVTYRDDGVRTQGSIIGSIANRPASNPSIMRISGKNFFGSARAPFPNNTLIFGNPNSLAATKPDFNSFAYGILWERYIGDLSAYKDHKMTRAPMDSSRQGDCVAAFSMDIPMGMTLRGISINFVGALPGYEGNKVGGRWDWGSGSTSTFPAILTAASDYSMIYSLMIATDYQATQWRTIPSIGTDAVKVAGANAWKEIAFKKIDFDTLLDENGYHLLKGSRKVHFKIVLSAQITSVLYSALSTTTDGTRKK